MMKIKYNVFNKLLWKNIILLLLEILFGYITIQIVVIGNRRLAELIDSMLNGGDNYGIDVDLIIWLGFLILGGFMATCLKSKCASLFAVKMQTQFRKLAGKTLSELEFCYFDTHNSASVMNKLVSDIDLVSGYYSYVLPTIITAVITTVVVLSSMWKMDYVLVLLFIGIFSVILFIAHYAGNKVGKLQKQHRELWDNINEIAYDNVQGVVVGRSYNLYDLMQGKIKAANEELLKFEFKRNRISIIPWTLGDLVVWLPHLFLGIMVLERVIEGQITIGEMTYFTLMLDRVIHPVSELPSYFLQAKTAFVSRHRLNELMNQPKEIGGVVIEGNPMAPAVFFRSVSFGYGERSVLEEVSFKVEKGEKVAFIGESGAGKSTIFKLLCGFYKPWSGSISLYGIPLENWDIECARNLIAIVSQNVFLFPETIRWNITCGKVSCSEEEIEEACRKANIHEFIKSLPLGYDTLVGERGDSFSGGQKQRISIARAFLKDAPIMLLDEPTSAVDVGTEEVVKEAIDRLSEGRTVLTIAHRLSTIEGSDRVYEIREGGIFNEDKHIKKNKRSVDSY